MTEVKKYKMGIDLGGTKLEGAVLDSSGTVLYRKRIPTPRDSYEELTHQISVLVNDAEKEIGFNTSVGIGIPGFPCKRSGEIKGANLSILNDKLFQNDISATLNRPVKIANDANCFTLSESIDGSAKNSHNVFGIIIGTGCGGGIVINKKIISGRNSCAGEWGHNPLPYSDEYEKNVPCMCGKIGCTEQFLSGPGLSNDYKRHNGIDLSAKEIGLKFNSKDPKAAACLERYKIRLGRALSVVINFLDPDCIVFGGGVSNIDFIYKNLVEYIYPHAVKKELDTLLVKAKYGDSSGVRGAAWL